MTDVPLSRSRRHTVLVIEDDSANRQLLASVLTREGYTVRTAGGGERGLVSAPNLHLDLIRLDIGLRRIDGPEGHASGIVGLVDAFDAMTHDRPYRDALSLDAAMEDIRSGAGRQFDPELSPVFLDILEGTTVRPN